jgi:mxaA protein
MPTRCLDISSRPIYELGEVVTRVMLVRIAPVVAALVLACTEAPATKSTFAEAVVDQPRLTGYFVGDLLTQRVLLERDGRTFTPVTPLAGGRVSTWFERRRATVAADAAFHRWLVVEYQILNAPPKLTDATLPAWQLAVTSGAGGSPVTLRIPSVSINIAPLSPPGSPEQVGMRDLRPDRLPPAIPTAPIRRAIALSSGALALILVAWVGWVVWRNRRAVATQPFARALREIRALDDQQPLAWQSLHRAFDRTAGRVIQSATLPALFEQAPELLPARARIEQFFAQSSLLFFGNGGPNGGPLSPYGGPMPPTGGQPPPKHAGAFLPLALCIELRRIERRNER